MIPALSRIFAVLTFVALVHAQQPDRYPAHWWTPVPETGKPVWEILPQAAKPGEVILSKRNELGILSNFAATPFTFHGKPYASLEGFWQMMLYPEDPSDPRAASGLVWPHTREQVAQMTSFQAKEAGTLAEANMQKLRIDWVTFEGARMTYRSMTKDEHYRLIREAMLAKLDQNPKVSETLLATGDLILRPDHIEEPNAPPEWHYYEIWMEIRSDLHRKLTASQFEFSDQPKYVIAGVNQSAYIGAHGSEATVRSAEELTRATASLKQDQLQRAGDEASLRAALEHDPKNAELHHSLARIEEEQGQPLEAVNEYRRAASLQATDQNLLDWGTELLAHAAPQAAFEVFEKGVRLYPHSSRILLASAVALYTQGQYSEAARRFFEAADLNPFDPQPYLFLGQVQASEILDSPGYAKRLARFAQLQPANARANYLYALVLLRPNNSSNSQALARAFLEKAIRLDPALAPAHLQLGILRADQAEWTEAIASYQRAISAEPALEQAHYRLAAAYRHVGKMEQAEDESKIFDRLSKASAQARQEERSELQRFILELKRSPNYH